MMNLNSYDDYFIRGDYVAQENTYVQINVYIPYVELLV